MNINKILKEQIEIIKPDADTFDKIKKTADEFCSWLRSRLKREKVRADVFIGGSLAKKTLVKKDKYDIDVFVRFDRKYKDKDISKLLGRLLKGKKFKKIHGSRDYYQLIKENIILEIVPVMKVKKPLEAENITDLSYFHVNYVLKKIRRDKKLSDEILLAKTFSYAQNCYGAESYISGFSGYALELLICHYGSFLKFIRVISKTEEKIIIDDSKFYKSREEILRELNESKINSPIILIDPTFRERNALAGLNKETFLKFKKSCLSFLNKPSKDFFWKKDVSEELKQRYGDKLKIVSVKTSRQAGDIAGTKLKKFFRFFVSKVEREFEIKISEFDYDENENTADFYFVLNKKKDEIVKGPHITKTEHLSRFKKVHPKASIKNHFAYAKVNHNLSFGEFFKVFNKKYKKVAEEMGIIGLKLANN